MIEEVLESQDPVFEVKRLYNDTVGAVVEIIGKLHRKGIEDKALEVMKKAFDKSIDILGDNIDMVMKLAEYEILFYDPVSRKVMFQTKLHERAVRELLEKLG